MSRLGSITDEDLERALIALNSKARDGDGRMVLLYSGPITTEGIRKALFTHLSHHTGDDRTGFLSKHGEEAFWNNAKLLIDALLASIARDGGSKLNKEVPWAPNPPFKAMGGL